MKSGNPSSMGGAGRDVLRRAGMRVTGIRVAVVEALARARSPLTAVELAEAVASRKADRVTIYRTLNSLVEAGLAHKVDPGDRVFRFRLTGKTPARTDTGHGHPHFVCDECGGVECLDDTEVIVQRRTAKKGSAPARKMRLSAKDVLLHGTCEECDEGEAGKRGR